MADNKKGLRVKLVLGATKGKPVRFSYLNVFEARLNTESGNMEKSVAALIPKTNVEDVAAIKKAIEDCKKDEWLSKGKKVPPQFWNPLRDGDTDTKQNGESLGEEAKGHYVLNCKTGEDSDVSIVGTTKDGNGKFLPITSKEVKSGDWGRISVNFGAYSKGTGGVGCYLVNVQLTRKGDPLGSTRSAEDDFGSFEDDEVEEGQPDPMMQ